MGIQLLTELQSTSPFVSIHSMVATKGNYNYMLHIARLMKKIPELAPSQKTASHKRKPCHLLVH